MTGRHNLVLYHEDRTGKEYMFPRGMSALLQEEIYYPLNMNLPGIIRIEY